MPFPSHYLVYTWTTTLFILLLVLVWALSSMVFIPADIAMSKPVFWVGVALVCRHAASKEIACRVLTSADLLALLDPLAF